MLARRIIACLDVRNGCVVKGVNFEDLRNAGEPAALARRYNAEGIDEIVILDVTATIEARRALEATIRDVSRELFIPLVVGGGIRSDDDASAAIEAGADKVSVNTAALADPPLLTRLATRYGSQAVVLAIDARLHPVAPGFKDPVASGFKDPVASGFSRKVHQDPVASGFSRKVHQDPVASGFSRKDWQVFARSGGVRTGRTAVEWAREAESRGAGEILLTSIDRDGTRAGFDCELTAAVASAVSIPVIASGGAGTFEHFREVFTTGQADAALAASVFHFSEHAVAELKQYLDDNGVPVRT